MREDLAAAVRSLRQSPAFTSVPITVLALGIGSATAIFSVVDAVVLRGLPFDHYDRLVAVFEKDTSRPTTFAEGSVTPQTYLDWRRLQQPFSSLASTSSLRSRALVLPPEGGSHKSFELVASASGGRNKSFELVASAFRRKD